MTEQKHKPILIAVTTFLGKSVESEREIDYADPYHRKWFYSHSFWAMNAGRVIQMEPLE